MHAQVVLFDGFDPLDVIAPYEVLNAGGIAAAGALTVELVSAEGPREVPAGVPGVSLRAAAGLDPERADLVIVPGAAGRISPDSAGDTPTIPELLERAARTGLTPLLREALARPTVTVGTVCGGSMLLGMAGLITGRHATTHVMGLAGFAATGVVVTDARVVDDGDLVSAGGVTSGLDLGLHLLERQLGPRVARSVERLFEYERRGVVWRHAGLDPGRRLT
ncbi:DJ-1/PfpI family protein [Allokutzneria oryzae]|uniref:DJ-1/PfpI family protein n=1 Tax=Allokutzneria oryzae TaxID=1378989 RepID=A0ABV5ZXR5_9PSEU